MEKSAFSQTESLKAGRTMNASNFKRDNGKLNENFNHFFIFFYIRAETFVKSSKWVDATVV